jgi:hypothetical protein
LCSPPLSETLHPATKKAVSKSGRPYLHLFFLDAFFAFLAFFLAAIRFTPFRVLMAELIT